MFAIHSSRDMLEKLKREIERLAGSIIRQEVADHALNAAMTAWHLTDWTWREIQGSIPRLRESRDANQRTQAVSRIRQTKLAELAYCDSILTNASTVAFANRNAPSMPSRLLRNGCR
jgi:hypothetical protein